MSTFGGLRQGLVVIDDAYDFDAANPYLELMQMSLAKRLQKFYWSAAVNPAAPEGWGEPVTITLGEPDEVIELPGPQLPAEVWHRNEADGDERMRAVRALSRGMA